jgi:hypothetical protein
MLLRVLVMERDFAGTRTMENGHEFWNLDRKGLARAGVDWICLANSRGPYEDGSENFRLFNAQMRTRN